LVPVKLSPALEVAQRAGFGDEERLRHAFLAVPLDISFGIQELLCALNGNRLTASQPSVAHDAAKKAQQLAARRKC